MNINLMQKLKYPLSHEEILEQIQSSIRIVSQTLLERLEDALKQHENQSTQFAVEAGDMTPNEAARRIQEMKELHTSAFSKIIDESKVLKNLAERIKNLEADMHAKVETLEAENQKKLAAIELEIASKLEKLELVTRALQNAPAKQAAFKSHFNAQTAATNVMMQLSAKNQFALATMMAELMKNAAAAEAELEKVGHHQGEVARMLEGQIHAAKLAELTIADITA